MKLLINSPTSTVQPLKFENWCIISAHNLLGVWLFIDTGIYETEGNPIWKTKIQNTMQWCNPPPPPQHTHTHTHHHHHHQKKKKKKEQKKLLFSRGRVGSSIIRLVIHQGLLVHICVIIPCPVPILASDWLTTVKFGGVSHVWRHQREI